MSRPDEFSFDADGRVTTSTYYPPDPNRAAGLGNEGASGPAEDLLWAGDAEGNAVLYQYEPRALPLNHPSTYTYAYRPTGQKEDPPAD